MIQKHYKAVREATRETRQSFWWMHRSTGLKQRHGAGQDCVRAEPGGSRGDTGTPQIPRAQPT
jgi:hypothetical protein